MRRQCFDKKAWSPIAIVLMITLAGCNRPTGSIEPPAGWVEESFVTNDCPVTVYINPDGESIEQFREQISFITEETASFSSLEAFVEANKRQAAIDADQFEIIEESDTTIAGLPARRLVYAHHLAGIPLKTASHFIIEGGTGFCISFCTTADKFEKREPELRKVCETFKIKR